MVLVQVEKLNSEAPIALSRRFRILNDVRVVFIVLLVCALLLIAVGDAFGFAPAVLRLVAAAASGCALAISPPRRCARRRSPSTNH